MMNNQLNLVPHENNYHELIDIESITADFDSSLSKLAGKKVFFRSDFSREVIPLQNLESMSKVTPYELHAFSEHQRDRQIVGIDSSCVLIGETEEGSIFAGRVAIVNSVKRRITNYCRAGPFIFYMNQKSLSEELGRRLSQRAIKALISDNSLAERYIRIRLERSAQLHAARSYTDSIILIDGAIRSSLLETRTLRLNELEQEAANNFNQLIGMSKSSGLRFVSNAALMLQSVGKSDVYFDITDSLRMLSMNLESRVLVARFAPNSQVFRVDTSRANTDNDEQSLADMKGNDVFFRGYPETLRLAHHLSVFDSSTISSTRSFLSKRYGLIQVPSDDLRATILGKLV